MIVLTVVRLAPAGGERMPPAAKKTAADAEGPIELRDSEAYPQGALPAALRFDKLLLEKSSRRLTAFAHGKAVRVYLVALGENPVGHKESEGDKRTPEGRYRIDDKNTRSAYHKNLGISYPNAQDRARAAAAGKKPGGNIKIHGLAPRFAHLGQAHRLTDWTFGCIAVTNPEIEELFARTEMGTPVEIIP
jgi:murein L,D-transpeptidase YafK